MWPPASSIPSVMKCRLPGISVAPHQLRSRILESFQLRIDSSNEMVAWSAQSMRSVSVTRPPKVIPSVSISLDETRPGAVLACIGWPYRRMLFPPHDYAISSVQRQGSDMDKRVKSYGVVPPEALKSYDGL